MRPRRRAARIAAGVVAALTLTAAAAMPMVLDSAEDPGSDRSGVAAPATVAAGPLPASPAPSQEETPPTGATPAVQAVDTSGTPPEAARNAPAAVPTPGPRTTVDLDRELAWVDGRAVHYSPASAFVLPGGRIHIDVPTGPDLPGTVRAAGAGRLERLGEDSWVWTAPERAGTHTLRVLADEEEALVLRAFVLVPETEIAGGRLHGYRMGTYPRVPLRGDTMYVRPEGFVEVTEDNRNLRVSPRFRLRHFETKQPGGFPRYVALQRRLLTKLELVVDALVDRGHPVRSLHVMSGYRTPAYNRAIGNTTTYSRHLWGDASDIFVDEDGNGWMDDLDGDGSVTRSDARVLYEIVDSLDAALDTRRLVGGLGLYGPRSHRGPFVHVDTRGSRARW